MNFNTGRHYTPHGGRALYIVNGTQRPAKKSYRIKHNTWLFLLCICTVKNLRHRSKLLDSVFYILLLLIARLVVGWAGILPSLIHRKGITLFHSFDCQKIFTLSYSLIQCGRCCGGLNMQSKLKFSLQGWKGLSSGRNNNGLTGREKSHLIWKGNIISVCKSRPLTVKSDCIPWVDNRDVSVVRRRW